MLLKWAPKQHNNQILVKQKPDIVETKDDQAMVSNGLRLKMDKTRLLTNASGHYTKNYVSLQALHIRLVVRSSHEEIQH